VDLRRPEGKFTALRPGFDDLERNERQRAIEQPNNQWTAKADSRARDAMEHIAADAELTAGA